MEGELNFSFLGFMVQATGGLCCLAKIARGENTHVVRVFHDKVFSQTRPRRDGQVGLPRCRPSWWCQGSLSGAAVRPGSPMESVVLSVRLGADAP